MRKILLSALCVPFLQLSISNSDVKVYPVPPTTFGGGGFLCSTRGSGGNNAYDLLMNTWSTMPITVGALCTVYPDFTFVEPPNMVGSNFYVFFFCVRWFFTIRFRCTNNEFSYTL